MKWHTAMQKKGKVLNKDIKKPPGKKVSERFFYHKKFVQASGQEHCLTCSSDGAGIILPVQVQVLQL